VGSGNGAAFANPASVYDTMARELKANGWQEDMRYQGGGPTGTTGGFRNGGRLCLASINWTPLGDAECPADQPIETCQLKPEQRIYTVKFECGESKPLNKDHLVLSADTQSPDAPSTFVDLDSGVIGDVANGDIQLAVGARPEGALVLMPVNGSIAYAAGEKDPGFDGCKRAQDKGAFTTTEIPQIVPGSHICVTTNMANLVIVSVDKVDQNSIEISFKTGL
jgi:hypothetical protein